MGFYGEASRVTVTNSQFKGGGGVWLSGARGVSILDSDFQDLEYPSISVRDASDVLVRRNQVSGSASGVALGGALTNVTIEGNTVSGNGVGLDLETQSTTGVTVRNNTLEANAVGVRGNGSAGVQIYHNRFLNNTVQARVSPGAAWDAGYLVGGNFWSDYVGKDECSGQNQDLCPDPDEFGDTAYCLGAPSGVSEAIDRYPLMNQTPPPARDPPPYVPPQPAPPVPGVLDPTAAGLTGVALVLGVVGTAVLLAAHARGRREDDEAPEERP